MFFRRAILFAAIPALVLTLSFSAQNPPPPSPFIPFSDARPILEAFADDLPAGLQGKSPDQLAALWPAWVAQRDAAIRARLEQGDWDTVVHWLLFGTSFTRRLRLTPENIQHLEKSGDSSAGAAPAVAAAGELLMGRMDDLLNALSSSTQNERILFVRRMLLDKGFRLSLPAGRDAARQFLLAQLARVFREQASFAETLDAARRLGNPTEEFAADRKSVV